MSTEEREKDATFLLTFASRLNEEDHPKGKPKGFVLLVAEGDDDVHLIAHGQLAE